MSKGSVIPPVLVLLFGIGVLAASAGIRPGMLDQDPGPAFMPRICGAGLILLSLYLFFDREPHEGLPRGGSLVKVIGTAVLLLAYLNLIEPLGFPLSTALFLGFEVFIIGIRNPVVLVAAPIMLSGAIYYLFRYGLDVALPATRLFGVLI
ncbi:tripartite tricarboxylate transporter TctB family protein [Pseudohoeflea suaedae]|uniref:Tripartite tricarboxylate transporter TctB family protein n=1 Tax=Pseudohoeflea suaedae TaxID=877384 RepID=A0A4R5PK52_9HYPH|nr:tripartite tricarboxylate transporter TctB family protein [Pseudohoeflea suaedae]TDH36089.1 tripartite tricarboxylate transporter TctB family protein [Pseudohoeflea suaedae]